MVGARFPVLIEYQIAHIVQVAKDIYPLAAGIGTCIWQRLFEEYIRLNHRISFNLNLNKYNHTYSVDVCSSFLVLALKLLR
jgi:hypothetical protein